MTFALVGGFLLLAWVLSFLYEHFPALVTIGCIILALYMLPAIADFFEEKRDPP